MNTEDGTLYEKNKHKNTNKNKVANILPLKWITDIFEWQNTHRDIKLTIHERFKRKRARGNEKAQEDRHFGFLLIYILLRPHKYSSIYDSMLNLYNSFELLCNSRWH